MSYTNEVYGMKIHVVCKADPQGNYDKYHAVIEERIKQDGYVPQTSYDNIVSTVILTFDCDDNYGEYDEGTGFGGHGDKFSLDECFRYVEEAGGWKEFDYEA